MKFCPARTDFAPCPHRSVCDERNLCALLRYRPVDLVHQAGSGGVSSAVHFVGFRGEEYHSAVRAFGLPDFVHRTWDIRAVREIAPGDTVIFAKYHDQAPSPYSYDDSNQPDDPAAMERVR